MDYLVHDSLARIAFANIDGPYWKGHYGKHEIIMRQDTCYFNGTKLCFANGKNLRHWLCNKQTQELIECCEAEMMLEHEEYRPGVPKPSKFTALAYIENHNAELAGTYIHPYLAPHLLSWLSPKFAITVSKIVNMFLSRDYLQQYATMVMYNDARYNMLQASLIKAQKEKVDCERDSQAKIMVPEDEHEKQKMQLVKTQDQMRKWSTTHSLTILNVNNPEARYPYYVIR